MSPRRPPRTLLEVAVTNAGFRRGFRAVEFALEWSIAVADAGELGAGGGVSAAVRELCDWWGDINERTAWRRLEDFRAAFPGQQTPAAIAEQLAPQFAPSVDRMREMQASRRRAALAGDLAGAVNAAVAL